MKKNLLFLAALFISTLLIGQERYFDERSVHTIDNLYPQLINPGAFGSEMGHQVILNYRNTWAAFEGAPKSITINYNGRVLDRLGAGVGFFRDTYGALQVSKGLLGASYSIDSPKNILSLGLSGEYIAHDLVNGDGIDAQDVLVAERLAGSSFFDLSFGAHGVYDGKVIYGLVVPGIISSRLSGEADASIKKQYGFIAQLGYKYGFKDYGMVLTPMITHKSLMQVPDATRLDLTASFLQERLIGGLSYTIGGEKTIGFLIGTKIESLKLFYGYQASNSDFQSYNDGSHALTLSYEIGKK